MLFLVPRLLHLVPEEAVKRRHQVERPAPNFQSAGSGRDGMELRGFAQCTVFLACCLSRFV